MTCLIELHFHYLLPLCFSLEEFFFQGIILISISGSALPDFYNIVSTITILTSFTAIIKVSSKSLPLPSSLLTTAVIIISQEWQSKLWKVNQNCQLSENLGHALALLIQSILWSNCVRFFNICAMCSICATYVLCNTKEYKRHSIVYLYYIDVCYLCAIIYHTHMIFVTPPVFGLSREIRWFRNCTLQWFAVTVPTRRRWWLQHVSAMLQMQSAMCNATNAIWCLKSKTDSRSALMWKIF